MLIAMLACKGTLGAVIRLVSLEIATLERQEAESAFHLRKLAALEQFLWWRMLVEVLVKLSQFPLPLTPQPVLAAAYHEHMKCAFQADIRIGVISLPQVGHAYWASCTHWIQLRQKL